AYTSFRRVMVSTVMKQPALVKSWQFPIDYEVPCTFTCIVLGDKSVVKARISGTSAAHIYFDGFIFNFPNQAPILVAEGTIVWLDNKYRVLFVSHLTYALNFFSSKAQATPFKSCPHSQDFTLYFNKLLSPLLLYKR
ncbi:hypothetical protein HID58_027173, partial [Brassica napus]